MYLKISTEKNCRRKLNYLDDLAPGGSMELSFAARTRVDVVDPCLHLTSRSDILFGWGYQFKVIHLFAIFTRARGASSIF